MKPQALLLSAAVLAVTASGEAKLRAADEPSPGTVYTMSNAATGNRVLIFDRAPDGKLTAAGSVPTGGLGTGSGLGSQGALTLSENGRWLLAVNAGSNEVTLLATDDGLRQVDKVPSGGTTPVSVTIHHRLVYVLNAGSDSVSGFTVDPDSHDGKLSPLAGSRRSLGGSGVGGAQVQFSPDGRVLVVTEKDTDLIVTFTVDEDGLLGPAQPQPSNGGEPFGFAFGRHRDVFVSDAFGGAVDGAAVSSYHVARDGVLKAVTPAAPTHQTAACWVVVTDGGHFAYTSNTGSAEISGYRISDDGALSLLNADGKTGATGAGPTDLALSENGRFLFVVNTGAHTIGSFGIESDGQLRTIGAFGSLPASAVGIAAK